MASTGALCGTAVAGNVATDTSVAFVSIRSGDAQIYVRDAQGGERMLTSGKGVNTQPAWSSTGKLAFSRRVGALNKIHLVNEDGSGLRQVTDSARRRSGTVLVARWTCLGLLLDRRRLCANRASNHPG